MKLSLLPAAVRTKVNMTIEKVINYAFDIDLSPFMIYLIDHVDIRVLKHLAYQFHILGDEGWSLCETEKEKRELLKVAISIHRIKGTKKAIEWCLDVFNLNGIVSEWFEYQGRPHRFKVMVTLSVASATEEAFAKLIKYINCFKNARSVLDSLDVQMYPQGEQYTFGRVVCDEVFTIQGVR